ncbi:MAG TPA: response regulator [Puia sp.]|jgi:signal transduction histidine kinase
MQPKILLVDDRDDNLLSLESVLEKDGYHFVKANSGKQVLKILLHEFDFALILMDVQMPNINGFETARLIYEREKLRNIPIIFITANNFGEENVFKGYEAGAVDFIYKPVNADILRAKVSVFVDLYNKNRQLILQEQKLVGINKNLEIEINERKISEEKVSILNKQLLENISLLESANKDLDLFVLMASHDLQAPLRKIRMFSDMLLNHTEQLGESEKTYINRIGHVSKQMQELINDLLEFCKVSGQEDPEEMVDPNIVLNDIVLELDEIIKEKKAKIVVEQLPVLFINPALLRPLFFNLLSNSLKYSKKNIAPQIRIYSKISNENKGRKVGSQPLQYCRLCIEDNGVGFEQKYAEEVFDMFRRLHPKSEFEGTGIGLALCKKIAEKNNGHIYARSQPGEGTTIIISLPMERISEKNAVL